MVSQGGLDEVAIWNRVLTSTEISEMYGNGRGHSLVPEPSSLTLLAAGGLGLWLFRRRRAVGR